MTLGDRFWVKVDRSGGDESCWPWIGALDIRGYGRFQHLGRNAHAHRVALILDGRAPTSRGQYACHHCDNKRCVNPRHLYLGTAATNRRDAIARGQARFNPCRGEQSHLSRLTRAEVGAIRSAYAAGGLFQRDLAQMFGVAQTTISRAIRKVHWADV